MNATVKTKRKNPDWTKRLAKQVDAADKWECAVGFPKGQGIEMPFYTTQRADGGTVSGPSILEVATWNNFGTGNIPARPFMDKAFPEIKKHWENIKEVAVRITKDNDSVNLKNALNLIGIVAQADIQKAIDETNEPENAPSTIKQKKSAKPLIDTGAMRQNVTYIVRRIGE